MLAICGIFVLNHFSLEKWFFCVSEGSLTMSNKFDQLHIISTGAESLDSFCEKAILIEPYVTAFHLRERTASALELMKACSKLIEGGIARHKIIINDRADVAAVAAVRGVQLAWHSLPIARVKWAFPQLNAGKSVHSREEAQQAECDGADYVLCGHIFATHSKPDLPPRGVEVLREIVTSVHIPVIAIGGIQPQHMSAMASSGAAGVAVMSGILQATDVVAAAKSYREAMAAASS